MKTLNNASNIWVISDEHFGHSRIIQYCDRPFKDVDEMNTKIINKINEVVSEDAILYHLGDFAMGDLKKIENYIKRIICKRNMLICGNHDRYRPSEYMKHGFEWASRYPIIIDSFWILSHEPVFLPKNAPYVCLHGHLHNNQYRSGPDDTEHYFNCCVENINYTPINFEELKGKFC